MMIYENNAIYGEELTCQIDNIQLNYLKLTNRGNPILLVHGNMSRWQEFNSLIISLKKSCSIFAIDLRGHGKSTHDPNSTYTLLNHANDIKSFVTKIIKSPVILIGNSLGGMIGYLLAAKSPELIAKLITLDSPLSSETLFPIVQSQQPLGEKILQHLQNKSYKQLSTEVQDPVFYNNLLTIDPKIIEETFFNYHNMVAGYDLDELFPKIKCPGILFHGEQPLGSMVSPKDIESVSLLAPKLKPIQLLNVGHSLLEKNDLIMSRIKEFLHLQ